MIPQTEVRPGKSDKRGEQHGEASLTFGLVFLLRRASVRAGSVGPVKRFLVKMRD